MSSLFRLPVGRLGSVVVLPKVDFGHLYKFKVSAGLVLIASSVALPWLILREQSALLVSEQTREGLSPASQKALDLRQKDYLWIVEHYRYGAALCLLGGVALTFVGFRQWHERQQKLDAREDLETRSLELQVIQMSPGEIEAKVESEVAEALAEPIALSDVVKPSLTNSESVHRYAELRGRIKDVDELATRLLMEAFSETHTATRNARLKRPGHDREVDLILRPRHPRDSTWLVEIKFIRNRRDFSRRVRETCNDLAVLVYGMRDQRMGPVHAVAVLVFDEAELQPSPLAREEWILNYLAGLADHPIAVLITTESRLRDADPKILPVLIVPGSVGSI